MNKLNIELANVIARMVEIDEIYEAGNGSEELANEYETLADKEKELNEKIKFAKFPKNICKNTAELVSLNID